MWINKDSFWDLALMPIALLGISYMVTESSKSAFAGAGLAFGVIWVISGTSLGSYVRPSDMPPRNPPDWFRIGG